MSASSDEKSAVPGAATVLEGWLTRSELAVELGLSVSTLERWANQGTGPVFIRIGLRAFYRRDRVRAWLLDEEAKRENWRPAR